MVVRRAERFDLGVLVSLCRRSREEVAPRRGGVAYLHREARAEPVEVDLEALFSDPARSAWLAVGTEPSPATPAPLHLSVGFVTARLVSSAEPSPGSEGRSLLGVVEDLYVLPEHRRRGLGRALLSTALSWLDANGACSVDVFALPGDAATKSLLETFGFRARLLVMRRTSRPEEKPGKGPG